MENKTVAIMCLASAVAGGALVRHFYTRETVVTQTQEVIKDRIVTVTREVIKPDGTKEINTRSTDTSVEHKTESKTEAAPIPQWRISGGYDTHRNYYGSVDRRILGPLSLGISARSDGVVGVHLGWEF